MHALTPSFEQLLAALVARDYDVSQKITAQLERFYPGQALSQLRATLENQAAAQEERAAAVRGLGRLKDRQAIPLLLAALADRDKEVRKEAARFLAPMRDARAVEPLIGLLNDQQPDVRLAAITPLGRHLFDPRSAEALLQFLPKAEAEQRPAVLTALSKSDDEQVMAGVIALLSGQSMDELYAYVDLVLKRDKYDADPTRKAVLRTQLQKSGALKLMLSELRATDLQVRERAASTLGQLEAPLALPALLEALRDESVRTRLNAVEALGRMRDERAIDALIAGLQDNNTQVLVRIVDALASLNDMRVLPGLLVALTHPAVEVRRRAAEALGACAHPLAVAALLHEITDPDAQVRCNIAAALARIGDPQTDPQIIDAQLTLLEDDQPEVRAQAAGALGELGDERAILPLRLLLQDSDPLVIRATVLALGLLGASSALEDILEILDIASTPPVDRVWQAVRESAIFALGMLNDTRAVPALVALLAQPGQSGQVVCMAINVLEQLDDERAGEPLRALLEHKNQAVRQSARRALIQLFPQREADKRKEE